MIESGVYNGFTFVEDFSKVDQTVIYKTPLLNCIITGNYGSVTVKSLITGATLHTATQTNWELKGQTIYSHRINYSLSPGQRVYIDIDGYSFSDHIIEYGICDQIQLYTANDCSNQFHDWDNDSDPLIFLMQNASQITPEFEEEQRIIINEKGQQEKTVRLVQKYRIEFYGPSNWIKFLNGIKINSFNGLNSNAGLLQIYNISVEASEQDNGRYSIFTLKFEYKDTLTSGSSCCDDVNIDDIISPENPDTSDCGDFTAEVTESSGTLSVNLSNAPTGTVTYKWYRNNVFLTSAATLDVSTPGNYRVDVRIGNCRASASYFKEDVCGAFTLEISKTLNDINGTVSNAPGSVTYEVVLNGVTVSTSLPYTATESGIYYVYAESEDCKKVKGINIIIQDDDCDFTASIDENGSQLEADTDAGTPVYLWELETSAGRSSIGTGATVTKQGPGIYWLTVTNGGCSKEVHKFFEAIAGKEIIMNRCNGTEHIVTSINLTTSGIENNLTVFVNGVLQTYLITPSAPNQYGFTIDGKLKTFTSLTNQTILIIYRP